MLEGWFEGIGHGFRPVALMVGRLKRRFLYVAPRYFRYLSQTAVLTPWVMGLSSAYLLAIVPQMEEVYIRLIEDADILRGFLGLAALSGFSTLLYCWNHAMVTNRIDKIYPDHADLIFDRAVLGTRDLKSIAVSALPFLGLCLGLAATDFQIQKMSQHVPAISKALGAGLDQGEALQTRLQYLPAAIMLSIALTITVYICLVYVLHAARNNRRWQLWLSAAGYVLTLTAVLVPIGASNTTLFAARLLGPLATIGLALIAGAVFLRIATSLAGQLLRALLTLPALVLLSVHRMPYSLKQLCVVLVPIFAVTVVGMHVIAFDESGGAQKKSILTELAKRREASDSNRQKVAGLFARWLKAREAGSGEYPIFIVTAQGGGIYAASAASFFLATMQERCPAFAEHIFAISGVSGGSVGATLFNAALSEAGKGKDVSRAGGETAGCLETQGGGSLFDRLRKITSDDHLSPVIAYVLPDLLRNIREVFAEPTIHKDPCKDVGAFEWFGRDQIIEKSFISSFDQSNAAGSGENTACPGLAGTNSLIRDFSGSWSPESKLPALLLNATWVETGYRVAFSPFPLQHLGGGTLYSFDDVAALGNGADASHRSWQNPSLIGAAAVSARFPFIMPPWVSGVKGNNRWTFVDGGYADASGATTGLELYQELKRELQERPWPQQLIDGNGRTISTEQIKLYLIVLSDAYTEPDFQKLTGQSLGDYISPFSTVLTVRDLLARRAVTEAYSVAGRDLITVQLNQETFPLSLGWVMSTLSSDVIRFTMGRPDRCRDLPETEADWPIWSVNHNSCELKRIVDILAPKKAPPKPSPAPVAVVQPQASSPSPSQLMPLIVTPPQPPAPPAPKLLGPWEVH